MSPADAKITRYPAAGQHLPQRAPSQCSYCGGGILHKHGEVQKPVKDIYVIVVAAIRYRCVGYGRAFTHYPPVVDRIGRSARLRGLMSLMWALGLSHRSVGCVSTALGYLASRMSDWRAVQEAGRVPMMGADETIVKLRGKAKIVGFVADAESVRLLMERDARDAAVGGGLMREMAQTAVLQAMRGVCGTKQCNGASDRQEQGKIQDNARIQEYGGSGYPHPAGLMDLRD